ncbi:MAG: hypothetical protein QM770_00385 [Tepidisphaeraceae bacterium]
MTSKSKLLAGGLGAVAFVAGSMSMLPNKSNAQPTVTQITTLPAVTFLHQVVDFDHHSGSVATKKVDFDLPYDVGSAEAAIRGFEVGFDGGEHLFRSTGVTVDNVSVNGRRVEATVSIHVRDNTGEYDDAFKGKVDVLLIASPR